jgi:hypothetical protein
MICKILHKNLKVELHETHLKPGLTGVNMGAPEGLAVSATLTAHFQIFF